jgi:hypothetical protein
MSELQKTLEALKSSYKSTEELGGTAKYTDGTYPAILKSLTVKLSKKNIPGVQTKFLIVDGPDKGKTLALWKSLEDNDNLGYTIGFLRKLNISTDDPTEIAAEGQEAVDSAFELYISTTPVNEEGKSYQNIYVNKEVDLDELDLD